MNNRDIKSKIYIAHHYGDIIVKISGLVDSRIYYRGEGEYVFAADGGGPLFERPEQFYDFNSQKLH